MGAFVKFFAESWYLFVTALVSGALLLWPTLRKGTIAGGVTTAQAVHMINRERAVVVDLRENEQFDAGHVVNSKNIPLVALKDSTALPKNKTLPLVLVCDRGAHSARAMLILKERGYENTHTLSGGLEAWRTANLPLEKTA
ncbi:MAG: hypothetical protein RLZZ618_3769 [Pseudomonadota bacterium]